MPIVSIEELPKLIGRGSVVAALDVGTKTIGLAVSDPGWKFSHPRPVLRRGRFSADAARLNEQFERDDVQALIVGLPINMNGSEGPRAQASRAFARNLDRVSSLPIVLWDERLSTAAAERALIDMDVSRKKRAQRIDSAAAAFILQGALDRLRALQ